MGWACLSILDIYRNGAANSTLHLASAKHMKVQTSASLRYADEKAVDGCQR